MASYAIPDCCWEIFKTTLKDLGQTSWALSQKTDEAKDMYVLETVCSRLSVTTCLGIKLIFKNVICFDLDQCCKITFHLSVRVRTLHAIHPYLILPVFFAII